MVCQREGARLSQPTSSPSTQGPRSNLQGRRRDTRAGLADVVVLLAPPPPTPNMRNDASGGVVPAPAAVSLRTAEDRVLVLQLWPYVGSMLQDLLPYHTHPRTTHHQPLEVRHHHSTHRHRHFWLSLVVRAVQWLSVASPLLYSSSPSCLSDRVLSVCLPLLWCCFLSCCLPACSLVLPHPLLT